MWGVGWGLYVCVCVGGWGVRGLLKMHTQASRGNDFLTLLFATTLGYCLDVDLLAISERAVLLHHR